MKKLLFIVGPTASGKTSFAVECAKLLKTEVISADSMQIYRNMNIGTAKATEAEMQGVVHHMLDIVPPEKEFSVAEYKQTVTPIIDGLIKNDKTPIICGGTGLYIDAILYPLNFSDTCKNAELRAALLAELAEKGADFMHARLETLDKESADKIHVNDTKRLIRALEINLTQGRREKNEVGKSIYDYLTIGFSPENRADLYDRINLRVDRMFSDGLISEVEGLFADGKLDFSAQSMQAIGYKEFKAYFNKEIDEKTLVELIKQHTRNYAKRQITWFKKYPDIVWFEKPDKDALELVKRTFLR